MRASESGSAPSAKPNETSSRPRPRQHRHAVPAALAVVRGGVAHRLQRELREGVVGELRLLHAQHVGRDVGEPLLDALLAHLQRVDVPRGEPHQAGTAFAVRLRGARLAGGAVWSPSGDGSGAATFFVARLAGAFVAAVFFAGGGGLGRRLASPARLAGGSRFPWLGRRAQPPSSSACAGAAGSVATFFAVRFDVPAGRRDRLGELVELGRRLDVGDRRDVGNGQVDAAPGRGEAGDDERHGVADLHRLARRCAAADRPSGAAARSRARRRCSRRRRARRTTRRRR